jgi:hypothetical protein
MKIVLGEGHEALREIQRQVCHLPSVVVQPLEVVVLLKG